MAAIMPGGGKKPYNDASLRNARGHKQKFPAPKRVGAYIYLIGWVAIQYHWILDESEHIHVYILLDESVLYFGESVGQAQMSPMSSDIEWLPIQ